MKTSDTPTSNIPIHIYTYCNVIFINTYIHVSLPTNSTLNFCFLFWKMAHIFINFRSILFFFNIWKHLFILSWLVRLFLTFTCVLLHHVLCCFFLLRVLNYKGHFLYYTVTERVLIKFLLLSTFTKWRLAVGNSKWNICLNLSFIFCIV